MDKETWSIIISALSAAGTISAVFTGIWLARREKKVIIKIICEEYKSVLSDYDKKPKNKIESLQDSSAYKRDSIKFLAINLNKTPAYFLRSYITSKLSNFRLTNKDRFLEPSVVEVQGKSVYTNLKRIILATQRPRKKLYKLIPLKLVIYYIKFNIEVAPSRIFSCRFPLEIRKFIYDKVKNSN